MKITFNNSNGATVFICNEFSAEQVNKVLDYVMNNGQPRYMKIQNDAQTHLINLDNIVTINITED